MRSVMNYSDVLSPLRAKTTQFTTREQWINVD